MLPPAATARIPKSAQHVLEVRNRDILLPSAHWGTEGSLQFLLKAAYGELTSAAQMYEPVDQAGRVQD